MYKFSIKLNNKLSGHYTWNFTYTNNVPFQTRNHLKLALRLANR